MNASPAVTIAQIHQAQSCDWPSCRPNTIRNSPTPDSSTPSTSNPCRSVDSAGTNQNASPNPMTPIGTLTMKIHCQPRPSTRKPPASGPTSVATPAVAPHTLRATPRRSGGKILVMVDNVCGVISAAPMPWTTRATISHSMELASPHHSDAAVNTANPAR